MFVYLSGGLLVGSVIGIGIEAGKGVVCCFFDFEGVDIGDDL